MSVHAPVVLIGIDAGSRRSVDRSGAQTDGERGVHASKA